MLCTRDFNEELGIRNEELEIEVLLIKKQIYYETKHY